MLKDVYVLLKPDNMDAANAQNHHVIKAQQDSDTKALYFPRNRKVVCESWEMKARTSVHESQIYSRNDDNLRLLLAEKQNDGVRICANCAKHFYADGV